MIRILAVLSAIASVTWTAAPAQATPGDNSCDLDGSGAIGDPYLVGSKNDLLEIPDCDDQTSLKLFVQTSDIDLGPGDWTPISIFSGSYSGAGYTISNLSINATGDNVGLFANSGRSA